MVQEALRLIEADTARQEFEPMMDGFVVSPENAREQLATFIKRAKKSLAIYDPEGDRLADVAAAEPAREGRRGHSRDRQGGQARGQRRSPRAEAAGHAAARPRDGSRRRHGVRRQSEPAGAGAGRPARGRPDRARRRLSSSGCRRRSRRTGRERSSARRNRRQFERERRLADAEDVFSKFRPTRG